MKSATEARNVLRKLEGQHPNADTELTYGNAFELLVATILSAQTTDVAVNEATPALFRRYPDAAALAAADQADVEALVKSTGFFRQKAKAIIGMSRALVTGHGGQVPAAMDALVTLPGVGRKTANVVLGHALGVPGLPVDRHVLRVTNRIGVADSEDPEVVEQQLCERLPKDRWTRASDTFILHGRRVCKPKPECDRCAVRDDCDYFQSGAALAETPRATRAKAAPGAARVKKTTARAGAPRPRTRRQ